MMKNNNLLTRHLAAFVIIFILIGSHQASATECDSINEALTSKFRFLGSWDSNGAPQYLVLEGDEVSQTLIDYVNGSLPESIKVPASNDEYFGENIQLNTELKEKSKVYLTMVHEGAGWRNTLGFYTYDLDNPPQTVYDIDSMVILFPNVSQYNVVSPGDKILLGEFPAQTGIGYFLIAQGWVGDTICIASHIVFTDKHLNTFTTEAYQQQTILLNYEPEDQLLLCFEDIIRPGGDNDFNDAVFYVTAAPGAIDTTNIPVIPTAHLTGDTSLCNSEDPAVLTVNFKGKSPFSFTYGNGIEQLTVSGITEKVYSFETLLKDTIKITEFSDARKAGIATGQAIVNVSYPKALLSLIQALCGDEGPASVFKVELEGISPMALTYTVDGQEVTIENIIGDQYEILADEGQVISLVSVNDQFCTGEVSEGSYTARSLKAPDLTFSGQEIICGDVDAQDISLDLSLEGEGPWTINYLVGKEEFNLEVTSATYQLNIPEPNTVKFQSITDANCTTSLNSSIDIQNKPLPSATIANYQSNCGDDHATVDLTFEGEAPWTVGYLFNSQPKTIESLESTLQLTIDENGAFELVNVKDAFCETPVEGAVDINIPEIPTATISGDAAICVEDEAIIQVALTGEAPFTFVYTDGETETEVTTEENLYEFASSEFKTYSIVSISDAHCDGLAEGSATITDASESINAEIDAEDSRCFGDEIALALIGETDNLVITWSTEGSGTFANTDQLNTIYHPGENEAGPVVFFAEVDNGCSVKTVSKTITIQEELDPGFTYSPDHDLLTETQINFIPNNNSYDEYSWDFGDGSTSGAVNSSIEYQTGGIYEVNLTVVFAGCEGDGSAELEVLAKDELYIPNAFYPFAQNTENQVVKVYGNNIEDADFFFKIVNRWGKVMYETHSFYEANAVGWAGINNNTDEEQELNVFTYIVRGKFIEGEPFEKVGTITQVK
jgi:hypothetical protein